LSVKYGGGILERDFRILDSEHGMIEPVVEDIGFIFLQFLLIDEFDPVAVWIQDKGNVFHSSVAELLLEGHPETLETGTGIFQGADRDADLD
jgi:hypothetical protein